jgi:hypothetical protein
MSSALTSPRRPALLAMKLEALVRERFGAADVEPAPFPGGAALVRDGEAWILVEDDPARALGGAFVWSARRGAARVHLITEEATGLLARRAGFFDLELPVSVWRAAGRTIEAAEPEPRSTAQAIPEAVAALRPVIEQAGIDAVEEHGVLAGEVAGLEVCRAVVDDDGRGRLDVGLGAHDREAFALVHGRNSPVGPALADVAGVVASHRRPGAAPHALNRLARERYLRWQLCRQPARLGLTALDIAPPPVPRTNVKQPVPCVAVGVAGDGEPVVVVCSAGVDLDLVPFAADARDALALDGSRLLLAVPPGDDQPSTRLLAGRLLEPADVVTVTVSPARDEP